MHLITALLLLLSLSRCGKGFNFNPLMTGKGKIHKVRKHQRSPSALRSPSYLRNFPPLLSSKPDELSSDLKAGNKTRSSRNNKLEVKPSNVTSTIERDIVSPSLTDLETIDFPNANISRRSVRQDSADLRNNTNVAKTSTDSLIINWGNSSGRSNKTSVIGTYFPFFQTSTNTNDHIVGSLSSSRKAMSRDHFQTNNSVADRIDVVRLLAGKNPNDLVTVADLQKIFLSVSVSQIPRIPTKDDLRFSEQSSAMPGTTGPSGTKSTTNSRRQSQVAFPQPSIVSYRDVQRGSSVAGGFLGMVLGTTILPNLWLVGMLLGAVYGYDVGKEPTEVGGTRLNNPNMFARFLIYSGRHLAKAVLQLYDYWKTMWFLYKTGQLSYEYYKTYESLDRRFAIQSKLDAWNARFVEGKKRFDAWEHENEVGRTLLAGLRTVWLVDEQARRRAKEKSRYRLIQSLYDVKYWIIRWIGRFRLWFRTLFQQDGPIQVFLKGVQVDFTSQGSMSSRFGAAVAAVATVNIGGAIFSISPGFSNLLAIMVAIVWPSWVSDVVSRIKDIGEEFQAKGRGEDSGLGIDQSSRRTSLSSSFDARQLIRSYDKSRYHFFIQSDGKTKRYYRTGQSVFSKKAGDKSTKTSGAPRIDWFLRRSEAKVQRKIGFWGFLRRE